MRRLGRQTICPPERETQPVWTQSWLGQSLWETRMRPGSASMVMGYSAPGTSKVTVPVRALRGNSVTTS